MIIIPIYNIGELLYNNTSKFFVKIGNESLGNFVGIDLCKSKVLNIITSP